MIENQNQPREYDVVLGGKSQVPLGAAVLGGIPGVKNRLALPILEAKIAALSEALKYGDAGLDLIVEALQNESMTVKFAAYSLLKQRNEPNLKQQFKKYLPTFYFDVIKVDAEGKENRRSRHYAHFFPEDLGNLIVLEMVYIPGGTIMMGSPATETGRYDYENPQHRIRIPTFFVGKYPITQAQWQAVMGHNPSRSRFQGAKLPVDYVEWNAALEFCSKLSQQTGKKYRLLSEAEWEYACRAGTTTPFYFGETITRELANYHGYVTYGNGPRGPSSGTTTYVGCFPPNAFGLYDMHGNVYEWCSDRWHDSYNGAPTDGSSWETGTSEYLVQRGGSWNSSAVVCRSAHRSRHLGHYSYGDIGLRVACVLP